MDTAQGEAAPVMITFLTHMLKFFSDAPKDSASAAPVADLTLLVPLLKAMGFRTLLVDKSIAPGSGGGCRVILVCNSTGCRVTMGTEGRCTCPREEELQAELRKEPRMPLTRQAAPREQRQETSAVPSIQETSSAEDAVDSIALGEEASSCTSIYRERTWCRLDAPRISERCDDIRRQSAPPVTPTRLNAWSSASQWMSVSGDDFNLAAATELITEALGLLSGVKPVSNRNLPVGSMGRGIGRRVSSDSLQLKRTPSVSSGISVSSSTRMNGSADVQRTRTVGDTTRSSIRRTLSAVSAVGPKVESRPKGETSQNSLGRTGRSLIPLNFKMSRDSPKVLKGNKQALPLPGTR